LAPVGAPTGLASTAPSAWRDVSALLRAEEVMSREVVSGFRETPIRRVVELMLGRTYRAIPVVESGMPVGIITNTDLLRRPC
jgi:CBS domain-containing protein